MAVEAHGTASRQRHPGIVLRKQAHKVMAYVRRDTQGLLAALVDGAGRPQMCEAFGITVCGFHPLACCASKCRRSAYQREWLGQLVGVG